MQPFIKTPFFDEVCFQLEGKYNPSNEQERLTYCKLINDVIILTKRLINGNDSGFKILIFESETTKAVYSWNGENKEANNTIYSDRLLQWDYEKTRSLMQKHFGQRGDYWHDRTPEKIEKFLQEWVGSDKLKLILVMEYCNVSNGYPVWRFDFAN